MLRSKRILHSFVLVIERPTKTNEKYFIGELFKIFDLNQADAARHLRLQLD
jgi:hypothetical protein